MEASHVQKQPTVDSEPLILILALGKLHNLSQATSTKRDFSILPQLVARSASLADTRAELVLCPLVTGFAFLQVSRSSFSHASDS